MLEDFLTTYAAKKWAWGAADCSLILADWMVANGRPDPAAHLRGAYHNPLACARLVRRAGGLVELVDSLAEAAGLTRPAHPVPGAVGVVGGRAWRRWGAIYDGRWWCVRIEPGLVRMAAQPLTMWSL